MATEDVRVLSIQTIKSVQNVRQLRDVIDLLKKSLKEEGKTMQENKRDADLLRAAQGMLRDIMYASTQTVDELKESTDAMIDSNGELVRNVEGLTVSYNDLVHQLDDLKRAWRATTDEAERRVLTEQIDKVNSKLKQMDASVGTFSRNVGNYTNQVSKWTEKMVSGFSATAGGARSLVNPIANVTAGLKAMSATPAVAVMGLLANALSVVVREMKSSEENTNKMNRALAAFAPIADGVRSVIQTLGGALADFSGKIVDVLDKWGLLSEASKERMALADEEADLSDRRRDNLTAEATLERDLAIHREKAADKEKYDTAERIKFLEDAWLEEKAILTNRKALLQQELDIARQKRESAKDQAAADNEIARLEAAVIKADADISKAKRQNHKEIDAIRKEEQAASRQAAQDAKREAKEKQQAAAAELAAERDLLLAEAELLAEGSEERLAKMKEARRAEYDIDVEAAKEKIKNEESLQRTLTMLEEKYNRDIEKLEADHARAVAAEEVRVYENRMNAAEEGSAEYLAAAVELRKKELEVLSRLDGETDAAFEGRLLAAQKAVQKAEQDLTNAALAAGRQVLQNTADALVAGTRAQLEALVELAAYDYDNLAQQIGETAEQFEARRIAAANTLHAAIRAVEDKSAEEDRLWWENRMNVYQEGSLAYLSAAVDLKRYELDTLHQLEEESDAEFRARQLEAERAHLNAISELWDARLNVGYAYADAISSLLANLADIYEEDSENNEKAVQQVKNLRIASAIIDTVSGAVAAYMNGVKTIPIPSWAGITLGAIQAASVLAAGYAQVAKIRNTQVSRSSSSSSSVSEAPTAAPPAVPQTVQQTALVQAAYNTRQLNQRTADQRVYILQSDLEASGRQVQVRESESTF